MPTPVNHPATPVIDAVTAPSIDPLSCEEVASEFEIELGTHRANTKPGPTKLSRREYQSHHILQDAATDDLCPRKDALAVMLEDSNGETEHCTVTQRQNDRMRNKASGTGGPARTFGELKDLSRQDLVAALVGRRRSVKTGQAMTLPQAERAAQCLVDDAERAVRSAAEAKEIVLNDRTPVARPGGCFAAGTGVWLADGRMVLVETLVCGARVHTELGPRPLTRIDLCHHDLVEIVAAGTVLRVASYHRLRGGDGQWIPAYRIRPGHELCGFDGTVRVDRARSVPGGAHDVVRLGFSESVTCYLGPLRICAEVPDRGPPMVPEELEVRPCPP